MNRQRAGSEALGADGVSAGEGAGEAPGVTPAIAAEAAVWIARLHGPERSRRMERECLDWQARSAAHREAFERCTETWQNVSQVTLSDAYAAAGAAAPPGAGRPDRRRWGFALGLAGLVCLMVGGASVYQRWRDAGSYSTEVGEQLQVMLDDGTRLSLNTATRVRVAFGAAQRRVDVQSGEAMFEVAKDERRPFVVRVAGSEVVALGTTFSVRLGPERGTRGPSVAPASHDTLAVTLLEGRVTLRAVPAGRGVAPQRDLALQPGERVRLVDAGGTGQGVAAQVDRPSLDQVVAWRRAEAMFDDATLAQAVAEMNRYSRTVIVLVGDPALAALPVSGLFRAGDSAGFARAVAALHGLAVRETDGRLELAAAP